ncbi:hypothetical protein LTR17_016124 [Elasticomyces elasticus]|nr:hypothetical protein LTR17_016124 [Elasticomyces elasticus]
MFRPRFSRKQRSNDDTHRHADAIPGAQRPSDNLRENRQHSLPHEYDEETSDALLPDTGDVSRDPHRSWWEGRDSSSQHSRRKSEADSGPLGLDVVYSPETGGYKADIVFIHGLGGTSRLTWSKHKNPDLFWPLHFLPLEPDVGQARILTFGYDANFRRRGSVSVSISDFAKDLLFELKYAKDDAGRDLNVGSVPLIFVVHSMGGLIIKEAYIQGQNDPEYESIIKAIVAITFLATPHRGTNLATLLNLILTSTMFSNPKQYINDLHQNSIALQKLNDQFRHIAPKLNIVSFYETQPTPIGLKNAAVLILEKETSVLGYPGETSKALNADHHNICKYENPQDPNYIIVRNILKSLVSKVFMNTRSSSKSNVSSRRQSRDLKALLAITALPDADYIFFRDQWTEGTGHWILEDKKYLAWFKPAKVSEGTRILWLSGGPGTGKSVLSSLIINEIVKQGCCCQYFFIRSSDQKSRGLSLLLRSVAYQLARSVPAVLERALDVTDEGFDLGTADARMIWERLFKSAVLSTPELPQPLYWIIDGVDEATDPRAVIRVLSDIHTTAADIRILFVSRKTSEISAAFEKISSALKPDSTSIEAHLDDLHCYIGKELNLAASAEFQADVVQRIVDGSQNNFLWVRLAVEKLNLCHTEADIDAALQELPAGMEALYDRMGSSIAQYQNTQDKALATSILQCITTSFRVLSIAELSQAIHEDTSRILDVQRSIVDLCAAFAVVDNDGNVAMVHQTARQYLLAGGSKRPYSIQKELAHAHMFTSCMRSLMVVGLRAKIQSQQTPEFLDYAATAWSKHLVFMDYHWKPATEVLSKFLSGPWILTWIHYLSETNQLGVLVEAARDLSIFFSRQHKIQGKLEEEGSTQLSRQSLLEGWASDLIKIVGKFGTILRRNPGAIYKLIPPFCPRSSSIYQIFGKAEAMSLSVSGVSSEKWDDSIAHISFGLGSFAASIATAGSHIAILATAENSMSTFLYDSSTFEALPASPIRHGERVQKIELNSAGTILATYGYRRTSTWNITTGERMFSIDNFKPGQKALTMLMIKHDTRLLVGTDDRCLRALDLTGESGSWQTVAELDEEEIEGHHLNSASFMATNRDGSLIAVAYRGHPLCAWEVDEPMLLGHCWRLREEVSFGQVVDAAWSPQYPEIYGLYTEGTLFKWQPYDDERREIPVGASKLSISTDGNLIATGDARGTVKIFTTADLSVLYQLTAEETVFGLAFSPDMRRVYDIRGYHANAWEPNALMKFAERRDMETDSRSDTESLTASSSHSGPSRFERINSVTVLSASPTGRFYSYGTDKGDVFLYDNHALKLSQIFTAKSFFSIELMEWSENGQYLACSYSGKRVIIMSVKGSYTVSEQTPMVEIRLDIAVKMDGGPAPVSQLLYDRGSTRLAVLSTTSVQIVSLSSLAITHSVAFHNTSQCKWIAHPQNNDLMLGVMTDTVRVLDWELSKQQNYSFEHPPLADDNSRLAHVQDLSNIEPASTAQPSVTLDPKGAIVDRVVVSRGHKKLLLVQMSFTRSRRKVFLRFDTSWFLASQTSRLETQPPNSSTDTVEPLVRTSPAPPLLRPTHFFQREVADNVVLILDFLSGDRLVYLSRASAICSWRLPPGNPSTLTTRSPSNALSSSVSASVRLTPVSRSQPQSARHMSFPSEQGSEQPSVSTRALLDRDQSNRGTRSQDLLPTPAIRARPTAPSIPMTPLTKPLFYLPGDWINRDWRAPCVVWAKEKSLLCPRNGEVAVVRCAALA